MRLLATATCLLAASAAAPAQTQLLVPQVQEQRPDPAESRDAFGQAVSIHGGRAAVGAPQRGVTSGQSGPGYVVVYALDTTGFWSQEQRIEASDAQANDRFGNAVALSGDTLWVGAPGRDACGGCDAAGSVYVFEREGGLWVETQILVRPGAQAGDELGLALALDGDQGLAGAPSSEGVVLRYERSGASWQFMEELVQAGGPDSSSLYGSSLVLADNQAFVGAPGFDFAGYDSGAAYAWDESAGSWSEGQRLEPSGAATLTYAGRSLALEGNWLALGATSPFTSGPGATWMFERSGGSWVETQALLGDDSVDGDDFGAAMALEQGRLLIGAPGHQGDEGAVYAFAFGDAGWVQVAKLQMAQPATGSSMGAAIAGSGDWWVIGAPSDDQSASEAGAVLFVRLEEPTQNYCVANANSSGAPATISAVGSTSVPAANLLLRAEPVPVGQPGLFFYGEAEILLPFGNGFRCVAPGAGLLYRLSIEQSQSGRLEHALDFSSPPQNSGLILPGSTWRFQAWFRDPVAGGAAFDLSDGLRVLFVN